MINIVAAFCKTQNMGTVTCRRDLNSIGRCKSVKRRSYLVKIFRLTFRIYRVWRLAYLLLVIKFFSNKEWFDNANRRLENLRDAGCDIDHYFVVAELMMWLSVINRETRKFDVQIFHLNLLNDVDFREHWQAEFPNRFSSS